MPGRCDCDWHAQHSLLHRAKVPVLMATCLAECAWDGAGPTVCELLCLFDRDQWGSCAAGAAGGQGAAAPGRGRQAGGGGETGRPHDRAALHKALRAPGLPCACFCDSLPLGMGAFPFPLGRRPRVASSSGFRTVSISWSYCVHS